MLVSGYLGMNNCIPNYSENRDVSPERKNTSGQCRWWILYYTIPLFPLLPQNRYVYLSIWRVWCLVISFCTCTVVTTYIKMKHMYRPTWNQEVKTTWAFILFSQPFEAGHFVSTSSYKSVKTKVVCKIIVIYLFYPSSWPISGVWYTTHLLYELINNGCLLPRPTTPYVWKILIFF